MKGSGTSKRLPHKTSGLNPDERSLIAANLRLSMDERLRRHDAALHILLALRASVQAKRRYV